MNHEQSRPRGLLPYGTEQEAIVEAEKIIQRHSREYKKRTVEGYKSLSRGMDVLSGVMAVGAIVYTLVQSHETQPRATLESADKPTPGIVLHGQMESIRTFSELYCLTNPTATATEATYRDCVDEQLLIQEKRQAEYTPVSNPTPQPAPQPQLLPTISK